MERGFRPGLLTVSLLAAVVLLAASACGKRGEPKPPPDSAVTGSVQPGTGDRRQ